MPDRRHGDALEDAQRARLVQLAVLREHGVGEQRAQTAKPNSICQRKDQAKGLAFMRETLAKKNPGREAGVSIDDVRRAYSAGGGRAITSST
jgi:hypothetical protein